MEQTRGAMNTMVYREAAPATVLVVTDVGLGSGVVISTTGAILTNYHVVRGAKRMTVVFKPEQGVDIKMDLAYAGYPFENRRHRRSGSPESRSASTPSAPSSDRGHF